ncbi:WLM-domain-containing protein [Tothia fuscella]|uniref:WLM-domain-containing protein n=1 Tax=Tothia fuscella TaxID=1048955 RepID=A0A9P4U1G3_9PEZI|nr:WLM-domain-containing protein [Tothia fuscella]
MPLGFERLNERVQRPNKLINFIRPLPGSTSTHSQDFLERIAAICYPIMKTHHIAVQALEEYEWNREFIGRNFNAGEVIQLVLRSRSGAWMPFKQVQMVMMHELAHCKQMNHSKAFWAVRDGYCGELRGLWYKGYSGEGFWGSGRGLERGEWVSDVMPAVRDMPEHTCGGTFRSGRRGRKRKRGAAEGEEKPKVSYAERQQRRILKKFGTGGVALGDDEATRVKLEEGKKKPKGKPRVAGSARGRDLRAAAALARFDQAKSEEVKKEEDTEDDSDDDYDWPLTDDEAVTTQDGKKVFDGKGHDMVRVCDAEDEDDINVKRELQELIDIDSIPSVSKPKKKPTKPKPTAQKKSIKIKASVPTPTSITKKKGATSTSEEKTIPTSITKVCPCCSYANEKGALICITCNNVLNTTAMPNYWRCQSLACRGGQYVNMGDYGICQICGAKKP